MVSTSPSPVPSPSKSATGIGEAKSIVCFLCSLPCDREEGELEGRELFGLGRGLGGARRLELELPPELLDAEAREVLKLLLVLLSREAFIKPFHLQIEVCVKWIDINSSMKTTLNWCSEG